jgi:hypothetical protein
VNLSVQLRNNHFGNCQTEAHPSFVDFSGMIEATEELEKFLDLVLFNTNTSVLDGGNQFAVFVANTHSNPAMEGELDCIAN